MGGKKIWPLWMSCVLSVHLVKDLAEMSILLGLAWLFCLLMAKHTLAVNSVGKGSRWQTETQCLLSYFFSADPIIQNYYYF